METPVKRRLFLTHTKFKRIRRTRQYFFINKFWFRATCLCFTFSNIRKLPKHTNISQFPNCHCMFCNRYWFHITKIPFMFFDRCWSHIQIFWGFIGRIIIIVRCPPFPHLVPNFESFWLQTCHSYKKNIIFRKRVHIFLYCLKLFGIWKCINKGSRGSKVQKSWKC